MQKINGRELFLLCIILHIDAAFAMEHLTAIKVEKQTIANKVEEYLKKHPEYVPEEDRFVTSFIFGESGTIVHASVQPDLTTECRIKNKKRHPDNALYTATVVLHKAQAIGEQGALAVHIKDSFTPEKYIVKNTIPSQFSSGGIITANLSFKAVEALLKKQDLKSANDVLPGKSAAEILKIVVLLKVAQRFLVFSGISHCTKLRGLKPFFNLSVDVYPNEKKEFLVNVCCSAANIGGKPYNVTKKATVVQSLPFESATLALHRDVHALHVFIKDKAPKLLDEH